MTYTLTNHWLPASQYPLKAPYAMTPAGIVVHNTAGTASAREEAAAMIASAAATSFHVVIDEAEAVECIPFARNAWHAGDGAAGYANRHLIGLEIARSMDTTSDRFDQAEANAALYIAHVCRQYGWTSAQLHQHNWYSSTACPHRTKTHWQTFLQQVDEYIAALEGGTSGGGGSTAGANSGGTSGEDGASEGAGSTAGAGDGAQNEGGGSTAGADSGGAGECRRCEQRRPNHHHPLRRPPPHPPRPKRKRHHLHQPPRPRHRPRPHRPLGKRHGRRGVIKLYNIDESRVFD